MAHTAISAAAVYSGVITHAADNTTVSNAVGINKTFHKRHQTFWAWGVWGSAGAIALYGSPDGGATYVEISALSANGKADIDAAYDQVLIKRKTDDAALDVQFAVF